MKRTLHFDSATHQLTGPAGVLPVAPSDQLARRFLMLLEGQCLEPNVTAIAQKYGFCRQRYYQLLHAFTHRGLAALQPQKTGPKSNYRRTDPAVRQVLRHLFLDPDTSAAIVAQKLRQTHFPISLRSVQRIIADYGLQKKTLRAQPRPPSGPHPPADPSHPPHRAVGVRRPPRSGAGGAAATGR